MKLHEDQKLFQQAVRATSQYKKLPEIYIEKDYWVTYVLYTIFKHEIGKETVFKGGTALSKCHDLIERFSEDIDLVVLRSGEESSNQLKSKIRQITQVVSQVLPEIEIEGVTNKRGNIRKTAHAYAKTFEGDFGQVKDMIYLEATWLGNYEPYSVKPINSYIYEMMVVKEQQVIAEGNNLQPFNALVIDATRTLCEKIMSLVRFSYSDQPINELKSKIRHTYDIHQILEDAELNKFFQSEDFDKMILKVAEDDVVGYANNNAWLVHHPNESLIFADLENVWSDLKNTYDGQFSDLVFGNLPRESEILSSLVSVKERLEGIKWTIEL